MRNYVISSLELHLFFGRIMKEHAFFLQGGFLTKDAEWVNKADWFRGQFEKFLETVVWFANGLVREEMLESGEIVTRFTHDAEQQTARLTGISIDSGITEAEKKLQADFRRNPSGEMVRQVRRLNRRAIWLLNGLIRFKEDILKEVGKCSLFTMNYPLLIEHILREAQLYRQMVLELERRGAIQNRDPRVTQAFWNQIMMEHAQFIRGLLDPTECKLFDSADGFARDYCKLLEEAREKDCAVTEELTGRTMELTEKYRDFKAASAKVLIGCEIRSLILPLLADHVLREANHYLRVLGRVQKV